MLAVLLPYGPLVLLPCLVLSYHFVLSPCPSTLSCPPVSMSCYVVIMTFLHRALRYPSTTCGYAASSQYLAFFHMLNTTFLDLMSFLNCHFLIPVYHSHSPISEYTFLATLSLPFSVGLSSTAPSWEHVHSEDFHDKILTISRQSYRLLKRAFTLRHHHLG